MENKEELREMEQSPIGQTSDSKEYVETLNPESVTPPTENESANQAEQPAKAEIAEPVIVPAEEPNVSATALLTELKDAVSVLTEAAHALSDKFDAKIDRDEYQDRLFDKMYKELETYKKDLYAKLLSPFINETLMLISDYERIISKRATLTPERIEKYLCDIPDDLTTILENNGVETFEDDTEKFNPHCQRASRVVPTGNPDDDHKIAERLHVGYRWNGVMLKPEMVAVYKYQEGYVAPQVEAEPISAESVQEDAATASESQDEQA